MNYTQEILRQALNRSDVFPILVAYVISSNTETPAAADHLLNRLTVTIPFDVMTTQTYVHAFTAWRQSLIDPSKKLKMEKIDGINALSGLTSYVPKEAETIMARAIRNKIDLNVLLYNLSVIVNNLIKEEEV